MTAQSSQSTELQEIKDPVIVTTSGSDYLQMQREVLRADKAERREIVASSAVKIITHHLFKMLDELENYYQHHNRFESVEFAMEYVEAAYAARALGRTSDIIRFVEDWIKSEDSLPFSKPRA